MIYATMSYIETKRNIKSYMVLVHLIKLLRIHQWLKNLMLFFPPFLGGAILNCDVFDKGFWPFVAFSFVSSAGYIVNDLMDCEVDRCHPVKSRRSIPSGEISISSARFIVAGLLIASLIISSMISKSFLLVIAGYFLVTLLYSLLLKNVPVFDLFCIAVGFLLRLEGGGIVFDIKISEWLFLSVFLLSLFLSAGKRLAEKIELHDYASLHRKALAKYPEFFLDGVLYMTGGAVLVTYSMYSLTRTNLIYTVPLCCFGLMQYIMRVKSGKGGDPTDSLTKDLSLFVVGLLWVLMVGWGIYGK